jgi:hypothetical protein
MGCNRGNDFDIAGLIPSERNEMKCINTPSMVGATSGCRRNINHASARQSWLKFVANLGRDIETGG